MRGLFVLVYQGLLSVNELLQAPGPNLNPGPNPFPGLSLGPGPNSWS